MRLQAYIQNQVNDATAQSARKGTKMTDYSKAAYSLSLFLADKTDTDLLRAIDPDFVLGYGRYLLSGRYARDYALSRPGSQPKEISVRTLQKHFVNFRTMVRIAIKEGYLPYVDVFPHVLDKLADEFPDLAKANYIPPTRHDFSLQFSRLLDTVAKCRDKRNAGYRAALTYIIGIYSYGLEPEQLTDLDPEATQHNPRLGVTFTLTKEAKTLLPSSAKDEADAIRTAIAAFMKQHGIALFKTKSIFNDWLAMARERGLSPQLTIKIATGIINDDADINAIKAIGHQLSDDHGKLMKRWYVLCTYSRALNAQVYKPLLIKYLRSESIKIDPKRDFYDPHDTVMSKVRGKVIKRQNPAIGRFLFVNGTIDVIRKIDRFDANASILRAIGNSSKFATVPYQQIVKLNTFLRDFRDDVQLVDMNQWREDNAVDLTTGTPVRILNGPFAGDTGQIIKVKSGVGDTQMFVVNVINNLGLIKADLLGLELEPIAERSSAK